MGLNPASPNARPEAFHGFYVYQYSTGISSALHIAQQILDDPSHSEDYLDALRMGGSDYPVEILATAGVDVTDPEFVESAIAEYNKLLDEFAALD